MNDYKLTVAKSDYGKRVIIKFSSQDKTYPSEEHYIYLDWLEKYGAEKCAEDCVYRMGCNIKEHTHCKCHMEDKKTKVLIEALVSEIKKKVK